MEEKEEEKKTTDDEFRLNGGEIKIAVITDTKKKGIEMEEKTEIINVRIKEDSENKEKIQVEKTKEISVKEVSKKKIAVEKSAEGRKRKSELEIVAIELENITNPNKGEEKEITRDLKEDSKSMEKTPDANLNKSSTDDDASIFLCDIHTFLCSNFEKLRKFDCFDSLCYSYPQCDFFFQSKNSFIYESAEYFNNILSACVQNQGNNNLPINNTNDFQNQNMISQKNSSYYSSSPNENPLDC